MDYTCHSGGATGSDIAWENEGVKYGVKTIAYSFYNHMQNSKNQRILSDDELDEGYKNVLIAEKTLHRNIKNNINHSYVKNLLSRNWFQVKNSESIFAIGNFVSDTYTMVNGGTGWAIQMAIDNKKKIYFFDQDFEIWNNSNIFFSDVKNYNGWNKYNYEINTFEQIDYIPILTGHFAGIGTRSINEKGIKAIKEVYKETFK